MSNASTGQGPETAAPPCTVVCIRWGSLYGVDYVNRLHAGVRRHIRRPTRFVCLCDDPEGLDAGIEAHPIPAVSLAPGLKPGPWRKLALWSDILGIAGTVLFLDLDVVIVGPLDPLFDHEPGKLVMIRNWTQARDEIGNSSVMRFVVGSAPHLVRLFEEGGARLSFEMDNEQIFVTRRSGLPLAFWPDSWCRSFKHQLLPPWPARLWRPAALLPDTRVVVFTGDPRPHDALRGRWPAKWYKRFYKRLRPVAWLNGHWSV